LREKFNFTSFLWNNRFYTPLHIQNAHFVGAYEWQRQQLPRTLNVRRCKTNDHVKRSKTQRFIFIFLFSTKVKSEKVKSENVKKTKI